MRTLLLILLVATFRSGDVGVPTIRGQLGTSVATAAPGAAAPILPRFRRSNISGASCGGTTPLVTDAGSGGISGVCGACAPADCGNQLVASTNCGAHLYIGVPTATLTSFNTTSSTPRFVSDGLTQPNTRYTDTINTFNGVGIPAVDTVYLLGAPAYYWATGAGTVTFAAPAGWIRGWPAAALGAAVAPDDANFYWLSFAFVCNNPLGAPGAWSITAPVLTY